MKNSEVVCIQERQHAPELLTLGVCVSDCIGRYLQDLGDNDPLGLHALVMQEVEKNLLIETLAHCNGHRTQAAAWLGISRNTLRKKLLEYGIDEA